MLIVFVALALLAWQDAPPAWTTVAPTGVGFSVQAPGTPPVNPQRPGRYAVNLEDGSFIVDVDALDAHMRQALSSGDKKLLTTYMETLRDSMLETRHGTLQTSSAGDFNGHPSLLFTFTGQIGSQAFAVTQRIVLANDRLYLVAVIGAAGKVKKADVDRFHGSFRVTPAPSPALPTTTAAAVAADGYKSVSYEEALCSKLPPIAIHFEVPPDFIARAPTRSIESGCLLGTKDDLDRVTADPTQGDFSSLTHGVFRLRVSTEVINNPQTGVFDGMDGTGEEGLRRQLLGAGARLVTFKKETIAGLPALQIVADVGADRAYMLYLGNTRFNSNAILVNFHRPQKKSAADDRTWARYVAGIKVN